ncbi:MAG: hypothetical protein AB8C84_03580 [Oligoflexales bacterium]
MYVGLLRMEFVDALEGREMGSLVQKIRKKYSVAVNGDKSGVLAVSGVMNSEDALRQTFENILNLCEMHAGRIESDWMLFEDLDVLHEMDEEDEDEEKTPQSLKRVSPINFR